jgi:hypothetical protein
MAKEECIRRTKHTVEAKDILAWSPNIFKLNNYERTLRDAKEYLQLVEESKGASME